MVGEKPGLRYHVIPNLCIALWEAVKPSAGRKIKEPSGRRLGECLPHCGSAILF